MDSGVCLGCRGSAGSGLRSQAGSGRGRAFALCARGWGVRLQCSLRSGPAAARGVRLGGDGAVDFLVSLFRGFMISMGFGGMDSGVCLGCRGSAGSGLRSQAGSGRGRAFALCARGWGVRLRCSLRSGPAAARGEWLGGMERDRVWIRLVLMRRFWMEPVSRCRLGDGGV